MLAPPGRQNSLRRIVDYWPVVVKSGRILTEDTGRGNCYWSNGNGVADSAVDIPVKMRCAEENILVDV